MQKGSPRFAPTSTKVAVEAGQTQLLILAGIVLLLALAGGIFYLGRVSAPKPQPQSVANSSPQPSPTSQPSPVNETTSWKTYTDTINGFSFKYPQNWFIKDMTKIIGTSNVINAEYLNDALTIDVSNYKVDITVDTEDIQTLERFLNYGDAGLQNTAQTINTTIAGRNAIVAVVTASEIDHTSGKYTETGKYYKVLIPLQKHTLRITSTLDQKQVVNQILSTFKFID